MLDNECNVPNSTLISLVPISKLLLLMLHFDIDDDELTNTNSSAFAFRVWYLLIHYKIGEIRLESEVI